jgi:hypothetical protein
LLKLDQQNGGGNGNRFTKQLALVPQIDYFKVMNKTKCICELCAKHFLRASNECTRSLKWNKSFYCSRVCAAKANQNFGAKRNTKPPKNTRKMNPFRYYIRNTKRRLQPFDLTLEYLAELWKTQNGLCAYTNIPLQLSNHKKQVKDIRYAASIDRIDSTKGYIQGNVQFVSIAINYMKSTLTHIQTLEFLTQIASYFKSIS